MDFDERRLDVLDVTDNSNIDGSVPDSYSELLMLFANGTDLSGSALPPFLDTGAGAPGYESTHSTSVCPELQPSMNENIVAVGLDPAYDGYSFCECDDG